MKKPNLKIVPNQTDLTPKQRKFVDLIIKGKHTYKDAYCEVYDVKMKTRKPKFYGMKRGDLAEITRPSVTGGIYKNYRYCQ